MSFHQETLTEKLGCLAHKFWGLLPFRKPPRTVDEDPFLIDPYQTAQFIAGAIDQRKPFFAGRLGWLEASAYAGFSSDGRVESELLMRLRSNAGVFPATMAQFQLFFERYKDGLESVDLLALINDSIQRRIVCDNPSDSRILCAVSSLESYLHPYPWSQHLAGRRVLVVHPFAESIQNQYDRHRKALFTNPKVLPEFELKTLVPPQTVTTNDSGFESWAEALADLEKRVAGEEFDVALIGCGAYGFPLGAHVKSMGKVAIHLGGAAQLLFGISGKRWSEWPVFRSVMTDAWRPPMESERPPGWEKIEGGCYW